MKVLVAHEKDSAAREIAETLSGEDRSVAYVSSGREVLRAARAGRIDLFVIDASLRDIPAASLIPVLKDLDKEARIAITTSDPNPDLERDARQAGIVYFACLPDDLPNLIHLAASDVRCTSK